MFSRGLRKIKERFFWRKTKVILDERERQALQRENREASGQVMDQINLEISGRARTFERVNTPGIVSGMSAIVTRTAQEQRARNKKPI